MIVRISSEGQYRIDSDILDKLNEIDNQIVDLVGKGDEEGFSRTFNDMLAFVRKQGKRVGEDEIVESDVILPPPDITLDEAAHLFHGEGLVPG